MTYEQFLKLCEYIDALQFLGLSQEEISNQFGMIATACKEDISALEFICGK